MDIPKKRGPGRPFVKGDPRINRAGRKLGSRNVFSSKFVDAMLRDFEVNGDDVVRHVREHDPSTYIRVATALLPSRSEQEIEVTQNDGSERVAEIDWEVITGGKDADKESIERLQVGESGEDLSVKKGSAKTGKSGIRQRVQKKG